MSDTGSFGYGQQDPNDAASDYNIYSFIVERMMAQMSTMKLVKVVAVNGNGTFAAPGTVDVLPLVSQLDGNNNATPWVTVYGIPWFRLQAGRNAVICDPKVDDIGFVVASDRDISNVKSTKKAAVPGSNRKFSIADGIYIGGILAADDPTQYIAFTDDGITITVPNGKKVTINGTVIVNGDLELSGTLKSESGGTYAGAISTTGNISTTQEVTAKAGAGHVQLSTHQHPGNNTPPTPGT